MEEKQKNNKDEESKNPSKKESQKVDSLKNEVKTRLLLKVTPAHPFGEFQSVLKERSIKSPDMATIISEALMEVPKDWWKNKVEELTPLEFRVNKALSNPDMREKLSQLLEN